LSPHRRRSPTGTWCRALAVLTVSIALVSACLASEVPAPSPTPGPPTPTIGPPSPTAIPPATLPPPAADVGPAPGVLLPPTPTALAAGAADAQDQINRVLTGQDRDDLTNLLRAAQETGDEAQRYRAYLGAWQYMRDIYFQRGERPEHKALLDALAVPARSFPQYQAKDFELDPAASR
jgi:hypothetical protein